MYSCNSLHSDVRKPWPTLRYFLPLRYFLLLMCFLGVLFQGQQLQAQSFLSRYTPVLPGVSDKQAERVSSAITESAQGSTPEQIPFNEEALYYVLKLHSEKKFALALSTLESMDTKHPQGNPQDIAKLMELYHFLEVEVNFSLGNYQRVIEHARYFIAELASPVGSAMVLYNLNIALDALDQPAEFSNLIDAQVFAEIATYSSGRERNLRTLLFGQHLSSADYYSALNAISDAEGLILPEYELLLRKNIAQHFSADADILEHISERTANPALQSFVKIELVEKLMVAGNFREASLRLAEFEQDAELSSTFSVLNRVKRYRADLERISEKRPYRVGVLLPFSNKTLAHLVEQTMDGIDLAIQALKKQNITIDLVFADTGANPVQAQDAFKKLVEEEGVIAVLGPLTRRTTQGLSQLTQFYRVPLISFSLTADVGKDSDYIFRLQRAPAESARALAAYASDYLGLRNFAVIRSQEKTESLKLASFWQEVEQRGGKIIDVINVDAKTRWDYRLLFRKLTGSYSYISNRETDDTERSEREGIGQQIDALYILMPLAETLKIVPFAKAYGLQHAVVLGDESMNRGQLKTADMEAKLFFADGFGDRSSALEPYYREHWIAYHSLDSYQEPTSYTVFSREAVLLLGQIVSADFYNAGEILRNRLYDFLQENAGYSVSQSGDILKNPRIFTFKGNAIRTVF